MKLGMLPIVFILIFIIISSVGCFSRYKTEKPVVVDTTVPLKPLEMVKVDGGTFVMGDTLNGYSSEKRPIRTVRISSFYIGKYEVSQREWVEVMGKNPSYRKGSENPVERVAWKQAIAFCNRRSLREGLKPCYTTNEYDIVCDWSADGYRLPTDAEWEFAAKGGKAGAIQPFLYAGSNDPDAVAWTMRNSSNMTHPVGLKQPNQLGLYDMSGNVFEWCWDWAGVNSRQFEIDPKGPERGVFLNKVCRGGSYYHIMECQRITGFDNILWQHHTQVLVFVWQDLL